MPKMNKEWRAELRALERERKKIRSRFNKFSKWCDRQIQQINKTRNRAVKVSNKEADKITRRMLILEGRLS
jgi:hypothetical protein